MLSLSTTGNPLIFLSLISLSASRRVLSGPTVYTSSFIISNSGEIVSLSLASLTFKILSRYLPSTRVIALSISPTRNAATKVPNPTLPICLITTRHVISEIATIDMSKAILTVLNLIFITLETASMHPSPASGIISAGTYMNMPKAIKNALTSVIDS